MQVQEFETIVNRKLDIFLPQKKVKIRQNFDKPYITRELKALDRKVKREYSKNCKSRKYISLKKSFKATPEKRSLLEIAFLHIIS